MGRLAQTLGRTQFRRTDRISTILLTGATPLDTKTLIILALFTTTTVPIESVAVNIVPLAESDAFRVFIDIDSFEILNPQEKTFRTVQNVKGTALPMASQVTLWKVNCSTSRLQAQRITAYTDLFGKGQIISDNVGEIPGFKGSPSMKMEEFSAQTHADGRFRPYVDKVCTSKQISLQPMPEDLKCDKTFFVTNILRDQANSNTPRPAFDKTGNSVIGAAVVAIVAKSAQGKSLPRWIQPASAWVQNEPGAGSDCVKWSGSEWYLRDVFWPHNGPDGNGFLAVNLTERIAYFILGRDISLTQHVITHAIGPDPAIIKALSEGFLAPFDSSISPRSCYFSPNRLVCKK